jgi:mitochondrial fission protein ELM1
MPPGCRTWLLVGHRTGDNAQVLALGEALGWPFEIKRFVYTRWEKVLSMAACTTLAGVVKERSSALGPPWPDLVITAGSRNEPIARWIRRQSGGAARLVHLGRPWAALEHWDLVITTPQYHLPQRANVLHNTGPLHRITRARLDDEVARWKPQLPVLPRPHIAVLAGGPSGPYPFDAASGARVGRLASAHAAARGGSLWITTSARTAPDTADALFAAVDVPSYRYRWTPDAEGNPYLALLGLADELIVTGDSMSMIAEACATGRPVYLYDTGEGRHAMNEATASARAGSPWSRLGPAQWNAIAYRLAMHYGPRRLTRDIRLIQRALLDAGRVAWLGGDPPGSGGAGLDDVARSVARVRELVGAPALPGH